MEKILIVDDVKMSQRILEDLLKPYYEIIIAENGLEAIDIVKKEFPDLILMDIIMPLMDGLEATKLLKADITTKSIPIIFITSIDKVDHIEKALCIGGEDYIIKPFNELEVLPRINTQIGLVRYRKKIIELESNLSYMTMLVKANQEIIQPVTSLKGYLKLLFEKHLVEDYSSDEEYQNNIFESLELILQLLDKSKEYLEHNNQ
ncbi:MAG: response regulator [Candidatus Cloacimonetes bacterium]|jgi:PleD family two-component response regulator|nr:response regulator [Candidatus Cloacimonadota bacterium]MDD4155697.1 response regulator [Candidatus Cloacimonadota bacterium]